MPKFRVTKCVDAFAHYSTIVEADDPEQAVVVAQANEHSLDWESDGVSEYDKVSWDNIDPEEIPQAASAASED